MTKLSLFTILLFSLLQKEVKANYYFQDITADSDLKYAAVISICEDSEGFVWFGTQNGLYHHTSNDVKQIHLSSKSKKQNKSIRVYKLYNDRQGKLWICTSKGLYRYTTSSDSIQKITLPPFKKEKFTSYINAIIQVDSQQYIIHVKSKLYTYQANTNTISPHPFTQKVQYIHQSESGDIYISTQSREIFVLQAKHKTNHIYTSDKKNISSICVHQDTIYIGYLGYGVDIITKEGNKIGELLYHDTNANKERFVRDMLWKDDGELWIATHGGLIQWRHGQTKSMNTQFGNGLPHKAAYALHKGQHNNIWVGTYASGLAYYADYNYRFLYIPLTNPHDLDAQYTVTTFFEDNDGYIWIGSEEDGGVTRFNPKNNTFVNALPQGLSQDTKHISTIRQLDENTIGISRVFSNSLRMYDYKRQKYMGDISISTISDVGILSAFRLDDKWWISGQSKGYIYDPKNKTKQEIYPAHLSKAPNLTYNYLDPQDQLWLCTANGLYTKRLADKEAVAINTPGQAINLSKVHIYTVVMDDNKRLWIGTKSNGLYIYSPGTNHVTEAPNHALTQNADIYSIVNDKKNNIWYNTSQGLYQYNLEQEQTQHYGSMDGIPHTRTRSNSAFCSRSGDLYFGTKGGFNIIRPSIIDKNPHPPITKLASLTVNNISHNLSQFKTNAAHRKSIQLKHNENTLSLKLACNNYTKYPKNRFKYRLVNYDKEWRYVAYNTPIVFTKVPSGQYTLEAYAANNDGVWSTSPYYFDINIAKHPLLSNIALMLYVLIFFTICLAIYKEVNSKVKLRRSLTKERYRADANAFIYDERIKFYTNLSHELRNPLSLIISPIRTLLEDKERIYNPTRLLKIIDRNAKRLHKIIDQSIDFRLLEVGKIEPHLAQHDLITIANDAYLCFEQQINEKELQFRFTSEFDSYESIIDKDMIDKIMYNLLSNAIKYSENNDQISLSIKEVITSEKDYYKKQYAGEKLLGRAIAIVIEDTGIGISPEMLSHVFERFVKGEKGHHLSTGIGLHLCQEYAKLNHSCITVESEEGKGSTFTMYIPSSGDISHKTTKDITNKEIIPNEDPIFLHTIPQVQKHHIILLTEDNDELRNYLKSLLNIYYKTLSTKSAEHTLELLKDITPDLIISDITMPGIDGLELTQKIKENEQWKHIPVLLITGNSDNNTHRDSILAGADAFLKKPIEESLLRAQIDKILARQNESPKPANPNTNSEETFIHKVDRIIEENIHNPEFEIKDLLVKLEIGRSTLSRKLEAAKQLTPSGYIRRTRLKYACKLLKKNELSIGEIAIYVGFNSSSYFIRSFKAEYDMTPTAFRRRYS